MRNLEQALKEGLWRANGWLKLPITIRRWYGRLGNNIQQIALALLYAERHRCHLITPEHPLVAPVTHGQVKPWHRNVRLKNRFFYFKSGSSSTPDVDLDYHHVCDTIHNTALKHITPQLKLQIGDPFDDDVLVIHLRGGDIFRAASHPGYVQNPLSFYDSLIQNFNKTILVCEAENTNPIAAILASRPSVSIQSSSIEADFATLLRARNLAISGVGTFAMAAALCSPHLKALYCSDRYMTEHLNPEMIRQADVFCMALGDQYPQVGQWSGDSIAQSLMLSYQIQSPIFQCVHRAGEVPSAPAMRLMPHST